MRKRLSPEHRGCSAEHAPQGLGPSERHGCRLANQRSDTLRYQPTQRHDEDVMIRPIIVLAAQHGRYGYRCNTIELQRTGWCVGKDRVERIWSREVLKVPQRQRPPGRLWLNDSSCVSLRPEQRSQVWSYDFVNMFTHDGRSDRMLNVLYEHMRSVWRSAWTAGSTART